MKRWLSEDILTILSNVMERTTKIFIFILIIVFPFISCNKDSTSDDADVIIYGGNFYLGGMILFLNF